MVITDPRLSHCVVSNDRGHLLLVQSGWLDSIENKRRVKIFNFVTGRYLITRWEGRIRPEYDYAAIKYISSWEFSKVARVKCHSCRDGEFRPVEWEIMQGGYPSETEQKRWFSICTACLKKAYRGPVDLIYVEESEIEEKCTDISGERKWHLLVKK